MARWRIIAAVAGATAMMSCAEPARAPAPTPQGEASILASSKPEAGSTVSATRDELELRFDPPARLDEVTVAGPGGTTPMMVHAVGETDRYSLPLSGLGPGSYTVSWRATARGREYRGSFSFTVK